MGRFSMLWVSSFENCCSASNLASCPSELCRLNRKTFVFYCYFRILPKQPHPDVRFPIGPKCTCLPCVCTAENLHFYPRGADGLNTVPGFEGKTQRFFPAPCASLPCFLLPQRKCCLPLYVTLFECYFKAAAGTFMFFCRAFTALLWLRVDAEKPVTGQWPRRKSHGKRRWVET